MLNEPLAALLAELRSGGRRRPLLRKATSMANLRRIPYTKPIPPDATIFSKKGVPHARFKTGRGKKTRTVEAPLTEDGTRVRLLSKKWYAEYIDADGKEHCDPLSTDEEGARQQLAEIVRNVERIKAGIVTAAEIAGAGRGLKDHLADYRRALAGKNNCTEHINKTAARIQAILDGCGFAFPRNIDADAVGEFLLSLRRDPLRPALAPGQEWFTPAELAQALGGKRPAKLGRVLRREGLEARGNGKARQYPLATVEALQDRFCRGIGVSTSNGYLAAMKGFTRWLSRKQNAGPDPLAGVDLLNADADVRHERRALAEGELRAVLTAAAGSAVVFDGLTGRDRQTLYLVAMVTGFRASELASLAPRSFALDADPPTATVKAGYTKNGRKAVQPLPGDVAAALREYLAGRPAAAPLWPGTWPDDGAEMLRIDLAAAGITYRDADGRVADFHALRHAFITMLSRTGVHPKTAQELARHSTIDLTMGTYTHVRLSDLGAAVDGLPSLLPSTGQRLAATGTEGPTAPESLRPAFAASGTERENVGPRRTAAVVGRVGLDDQEATEIASFENDKEGARLEERKLPGQDSNLDKENQNALGTRRKASSDKAMSSSAVQLSLQLAQETEPLLRQLASQVESDPDLARLVDAWPTLPAPIRAAMLALLGSATGGRGAGKG